MCQKWFVAQSGFKLSSSPPPSLHPPPPPPPHTPHHPHHHHPHTIFPFLLIIAITNLTLPIFNSSCQLSNPLHIIKSTSSPSSSIFVLYRTTFSYFSGGETNCLNNRMWIGIGNMSIRRCIGSFCFFFVFYVFSVKPLSEQSRIWIGIGNIYPSMFVFPRFCEFLFVAEDRLTNLIDYRWSVMNDCNECFSLIIFGSRAF